VTSLRKPAHGPRMGRVDPRGVKANRPTYYEPRPDVTMRRSTSCMARTRGCIFRHPRFPRMSTQKVHPFRVRNKQTIAQVIDGAWSKFISPFSLP